VESGLVLVKPGLPQFVNVAVMAAGRVIAVRTVEIMAGCAGGVGINKDLIIMRRVAMVPVYARRHLASAGAEMTLNALCVQVMA